MAKKAYWKGKKKRKKRKGKKEKSYVNKTVDNYQ